MVGQVELRFSWGFDKFFDPSLIIPILCQAVLDDNLVMVRLLIHHGAKLNKLDEDCWTPLHAAAANGLHNIAR